jgi:hypothetical protein
MRFKVFYNFDGRGSAIIEAETKEETEEKFELGDWEENNDDSQNYEIDTIKPIE